MKVIFFSLLWILGGIFSTGCSQAILKSYPPKDLDPNTLYTNSLVYSLPKGMIRIQLKPLEKPPDAEELTLETIYVPDPKHTYVMKYHTNPSYEDDVKVSLTDKGLLSKIDVTTESKAGEIVMRVFEIVKEAIKISALPGKSISGKKYFDLVLDPEEIIKTQTELKNLKMEEDNKGKLEAKVETLKQKKGDEIEIKKYEKEIENVERKIAGIKDKIKKENPMLAGLKEIFGITLIQLTPPKIEGWPAGTVRENQGVYYRPLLPYNFELHFPTYVFSRTVLLPNEAPLMTLDVTRPAFIKKIINLTFNEGILTEVHINKPSEILAGLKIPLDIVRAIAAIPKELLTFKVEYGQEYNKYLQEQINELKNKQELEDLRKRKE